MNLKFSKSLQVQVAGCRLQVAGYTCIYAGLQFAVAVCRCSCRLQFRYLFSSSL